MYDREYSLSITLLSELFELHVRYRYRYMYLQYIPILQCTLRARIIRLVRANALTIGIWLLTVDTVLQYNMNIMIFLLYEQYHIMYSHMNTVLYWCIVVRVIITIQYPNTYLTYYCAVSVRVYILVHTRSTGVSHCMVTTIELLYLKNSIWICIQQYVLFNKLYVSYEYFRLIVKYSIHIL